MLPNLKPGQSIRCTIVKAPRARAARKTVERLMWRDPAVAKGLRKSHKVRQRSTIIYNRGNRDWVKRQECARIIEVVRGADWTMTYHHDLAADLKSVEGYVQVNAA
jgi:adenylate cyclase class IV